MKVSIVIPVLNQFQLALEAIESIQTRHEVMVYPVLNYKMNLSLSGAWNYGSRKAIESGTDYILIINDDIVFSPWTIDGMVDGLCHLGDDIVLVSGANQRGSLGPEEVKVMEKPNHHLSAESPDFACFMIRPDTIEKIGNFDENFNPAYFEDNDYHRRINLLGYKAISTTDRPYFHYGSRTQNADPIMPVVAPPIFEMNKLYYINKWGGEPGMESHVTPFGDPNLTPRDW